MNQKKGYHSNSKSSLNFYKQRSNNSSYLNNDGRTMEEASYV